MFKMCFGSGNADDDQKSGLARTKEIDGMIRRDEKRRVNEVKLLLLGQFVWWSSERAPGVRGGD